MNIVVTTRWACPIGAMAGPAEGTPRSNYPPRAPPARGTGGKKILSEPKANLVRGFVNTTCGASNISFGLPNRRTGINNAFLPMALRGGHDQRDHESRRPFPSAPRRRSPRKRPMIEAAGVILAARHGRRDLSRSFSAWAPPRRAPGKEDGGDPRHGQFPHRTTTTAAAARGSASSKDPDAALHGADAPEAAQAPGRVMTVNRPVYHDGLRCPACRCCALPCPCTSAPVGWRRCFPPRPCATAVSFAGPCGWVEAEVGRAEFEAEVRRRGWHLVECNGQAGRVLHGSARSACSSEPKIRTNFRIMRFFRYEKISRLHLSLEIMSNDPLVIFTPSGANAAAFLSARNDPDRRAAAWASDL